MVKQQPLCGTRYDRLCSSEYFTSCSCEVQARSAQCGSVGYARLDKKQKAGLLFLTTCVQQEKKQLYIFIYTYILH